MATSAGARGGCCGSEPCSWQCCFSYSLGTGLGTTRWEHCSF